MEPGGCARLSTVATHIQSAGEGSGQPEEVMALGMSSDEKEPAGLSNNFCVERWCVEKQFCVLFPPSVNQQF